MKLKSKQSDDCKSKGTSSTEASYVEEEYDFGALVVTSEYKGGDSWVLDSGCSSHMTSNFSFFSTYQKVDGRKVTIGKYASCPIVDVRKIELLCLMGCENIYRSPSCSKHDRHLIFLGTLDKEGIMCEGGVMKVGKGPMS